MHDLLKRNHRGIYRGVMGIMEGVSGLAPVRRAAARAARAAQASGSEDAGDLQAFADGLDGVAQGLVKAVARLPEECWRLVFAEQDGRTPIPDQLVRCPDCGADPDHAVPGCETCNGLGWLTPEDAAAALRIGSEERTKKATKAA